MKSVCLFLAMVGFFPIMAQAQVRTWVWETTRTERSALSVLLREGCDKNYLSQALRDSGIKPSERNNLQPGRKIRLRTQNCLFSAPESVARESATLLPSGSISAIRSKSKAPLASQTTSRSRREVVSEVPSNGSDKLAKQLRDMHKLNAELTKSRDSLQYRLSRLERSPLQRASVGRPTWNSLNSLWLLLGLLIGFLISGLLYQRSYKNKLMVERELKVWEQGQLYRFGPTALRETREGSGEFLPTYRCLECGEGEFWGEEKTLQSHAKACPAHKTERRVDSSLQT